MEGASVVASEDEAVKEVRMGHVDTRKQSFPDRDLSGKLKAQQMVQVPGEQTQEDRRGTSREGFRGGKSDVSSEDKEDLPCSEQREQWQELTSVLNASPLRRGCGRPGWIRRLQ